MTIANENNKKTYTGSGTSVFAYDFKINASDEILVQQLTIASGVTVTLTETTDYTVSGVGNDAGGNVTLTAGSFPSGLSSSYKLILTRNVPATQETDYVENDPFPAETHEAALDKITMLIQQINEQIDRSIIQAPDQTTQITFPSPVASKIIGWDSGGTVLENKTVSSESGAGVPTFGVSDASKVVAINLAGTAVELRAGAQFYFGSITRDATAASGDVATTGVGFTPDLLICLVALDDDSRMSIGFSDGSSQINLFTRLHASTNYFRNSSTRIISILDDSSNNQLASVGSFDSDGFTLSWTKNGTTTAGTFTIKFLAIKY